MECFTNKKIKTSLDTRGGDGENEEKGTAI